MYFTFTPPRIRKIIKWNEHQLFVRFPRCLSLEISKFKLLLLFLFLDFNEISVIVATALFYCCDKKKKKKSKRQQFGWPVVLWLDVLFAFRCVKALDGNVLLSKVYSLRFFFLFLCLQFTLHGYVENFSFR